MLRNFPLALLSGAQFHRATASLTTDAEPLNPARVDGREIWCHCGEGIKQIQVHKGGHQYEKGVVIPVEKPVWIKFDEPVAAVDFECSKDTETGDGSPWAFTQRIEVQRASRWWRVVALSHRSDESDLIPWPHWCHKESGLLHFATFEEEHDTPPFSECQLQVPSTSLAKFQSTTSLPFTSFESGYFCVKIPVLLRSRKGPKHKLFAFAEARKKSCSDFAWTDIVMKESLDEGVTWGPLRVIRTESGPGLPTTVVGNVAAVHLSFDKTVSKRHPGRIIIPHTRNNTDVWEMHSDDDGETWSHPRMMPKASSVPDNATWVATGPPGSIQLEGLRAGGPGGSESFNEALRGRIVVPSNHGSHRGNVGNIDGVQGYVLLSDDDGDSYYLGATSYSQDGKKGAYCGENQAVELNNGTILASARSAAFPVVNTMRRLQARSEDGGLTFDGSYFNVIPQAIGGVEGSIVTDKSEDRTKETLYQSGPNSFLWRTRMMVWRSENAGASWEEFLDVDRGMSGYSSMQIGYDYDEQGKRKATILHLLYEQSDWTEIVMNPDRFVYRRIVIPSGENVPLEVGESLREEPEVQEAPVVYV